MTTHIVKKYESQNSEILFRATDAIAIGQRKNEVVVYGEDPNRKTSRVFIDSKHASRFLREVIPDQDLRLRGPFTGSPEERPSGPEQIYVDVDVIDGEPVISLAGADIELPVPGAIRHFN